jgi:hypothetical protein
MNSYDEYMLEWTSDWACRISRGAGVEPGKGGRGKRDDPDRRLAQMLGVEYSAWLKYKAGRQTPNSSTFKVIHQNAIRLGFLGSSDTIDAALERQLPLNRGNWIRGLDLNELVKLQRQVLLWERNPGALNESISHLRDQIWTSRYAP